MVMTITDGNDAMVMTIGDDWWWRLAIVGSMLVGFPHYFLPLPPVNFASFTIMILIDQSFKISITIQMKIVTISYIHNS